MQGSSVRPASRDTREGGERFFFLWKKKRTPAKF
jgi:hypothetical protein